MSADPPRPDPAAPGLPDVVADDALLDRLAAGGLSRADRRDPAAEVLATVLADLEGRPTPRATARRRTRRTAIAVPLVAALLVTSGLTAAASSGDPWAPYRSALAALGLGQPPPESAVAEAASAQARQAQRAASAATGQALGAAEAALAAGDPLAARQLLAEAEAALPGAGQQEIGRLLGQLVALERILAAGANGVPGGPTDSASPVPNGNANGLDPVKQTGPPPVASPRPEGVNGAGNAAPQPAQGGAADDGTEAGVEAEVEVEVEAQESDEGGSQGPPKG